MRLRKERGTRAKGPLVPRSTASSRRTCIDLAFTLRGSRPAHRQIDRLAGHCLPSFFLLVGENGHYFLVRGLGKLGHLFACFWAPGAATLEHFTPFLVSITADRLDLFFLLVGQLQGLLYLGVGKGLARPRACLQLDLLEAIDLLRF